MSVIAMHRLTGIDEDARRGTCSVCGDVWLKRRVRNGRVAWSCGRKHNSYSAWPGRPHRRGVTSDSRCDACGFVPVHRVQLDVHHIDHDHNNNAASNLRVLCANCHRLEHVVLEPAA